MRRSNRFASGAALAACAMLLAGRSAQATGEARTLIPRQALFADPDLSAVALAGDGSLAAFVESRNGRSVLTTADPNEPSARRALPLPDVAVPVACQWSCDDRRLLVVCQRGPATRLFAWDRSEAAPVELAPGVDGGHAIAQLSAARPDEALLAIRGVDGALRYRVVSLAGGDGREILDATSLERVHFNSEWTPRAAQRAADDGGTELLRRDGESWTVVGAMPEDFTNVARQPRGGVTGVVGLDPSGQELLLVDNAGVDRSRLVSLDLDSGARRVLAENARADLKPLPVLDRRTGDVLAVSAQFGDLERTIVEPALADDFAFLEQALGKNVGFVSVARDDAFWLVAPLDGGPLRFHAFDRPRRRVFPLAATHSGLADKTLARRTAQSIPARDGTLLPCHLYVALRCDRDGDGMPDSPLPTLLYVHGGPSIPAPWESWNTNRCLQLLADRGYAVLNVDFRGAGGYGKAFVKQVWNNWGRGSVADFEDAARWAVERKIAQRDKIGIWGWSYGGLSTMSALAFSPDTFACGISMYGLSDLEAFTRYVALGRYREQVYERIGDPRTPEGAAALRDRSPLFSADRVRSPLLLTHGAQDRTAPRSHSDWFAERLVAADADVVYLVYPQEGHDYRRPESWTSFWAVAERFLHERLGGEFEPAGDDLRATPIEVVAGGEWIATLDAPAG